MRKKRVLKEVVIDTTKDRVCRCCLQTKPGSSFKVVSMIRTRYATKEPYAYQFQSRICEDCTREKAKIYQRDRKKVRKEKRYNHDMGFVFRANIGAWH